MHSLNRTNTTAASNGTPAGNTNRLLVVVAALLGANILVQLGALSGGSPAVAQPKSGEGATGFITTAEMVNRTNQLLVDVNGRLAKIESQLGQPLEVKIVSSVPLKVDGAAAPAALPPVTAPAGEVPAGDPGAAQPRPTIRIKPSSDK